MNNTLKPSEQHIQDKRKAIGEQIRTFRLEKEYSQDKLAEIMGINHSTVSKIENGKFVINIDLLLKLGWHLDFDISIFKSERDPL